MVLVVLPAVGLLSGTVPPNLGVLIAIGLLVWIVALFLVITPFRLWKADQAAIGELRDLQRPRLGLEFDPKAGRPYLEESATDGEAREFLVRKFRVGIANLSNKTIDRVRVVLDDCDPQLANVWHHNSLHFMGKPDEYVELHPGTNPTVVLDVVWAYLQLGADGNAPTGVSRLELIYQGKQLDLKRNLPIRDHRIDICVEGTDTSGVTRQFDNQSLAC